MPDEQTRVIDDVITSSLIIATDVEKKLLQDFESGPLTKSRAKELTSKAISDFKKEFREKVALQRDSDDLEKGLGLIIQEVKHFPHSDPVLLDLQKAVKRLQEEMPEGKAPIYDHWQEWLDLTHETLQAFYEIGLNHFTEGKMEEARSIFLFLTQCNPYIFEPWYALGLSDEKLGNYSVATFEYGMALMNNPTHSSSFLHSAMCYINLNDMDNAKEHLEFAKKYESSWSQEERVIYKEIKKLIE